MKILITGHRLFKLEKYNLDFIKKSIDNIVSSKEGFIGLSGMASGVDLWFCQSCIKHQIPYIAYVPFRAQTNELGPTERAERERLLKEAVNIKYVRNSAMVEDANEGIVVWDGNKGGTHNVFQQLVEHKKPFVWINPVNETVNYLI